MERLVKDLLRLARLDAGQETLDIIACDASNLIHAVVTELSSALDGRQQRVEVSIGAGAQHLHADPTKLHDALRNLIANAITYSPERTTIRVDTERNGPSVTLSVSDEGPGIPEDDLSRVFERFYRVDKSRARSGRHRPRPRHREAPDRAPQRRGQGGEPAGRRNARDNSCPRHTPRRVGNST